MEEIQVVSSTKLLPEEIISRGMDLVNLYVNKDYLIDLNKCDPVPLTADEKLPSSLSLYQIDKIVIDKNENMNDKLVSVYNTLYNLGSTVILVLVSDESGVQFYLGTKNMNDSANSSNALRDGLKGNFPGIHIKKDMDALEIGDFMEKNIPTKEYNSLAVTAVSIVPGIRDEKDKEHYVQGLEKFIGSMREHEGNYTAVFISTPISKEDLELRKEGYEELYTTLSQCSQSTLSYGENESDAIAEGISQGISESLNSSISRTVGTNEGTNENRSKSKSHGGNASMQGVFGMNSGRSTSKSTGSYHGSQQSESETNATTKTTSDNLSETKTTSTGSSRTMQITLQNKSVQDLMKRIDEQLERIKSCEAYGLWNSACYFISQDTDLTILAANQFKGLVTGEKSSVENSIVNTWDDTPQTYDEKTKTILECIKNGVHPKFNYLPEIAAESGYDKQTVTAATMISGVELPILMGFPHSSVNGISSIESASFEVNVFREEEPGERTIDLGAIYHMGETYKNSRVILDLESLSSHCFITGSTGKGKSNTTSKLIYELTKPENNVNFMVIEPAKGEYKLDFGGMPGINIYTTSEDEGSMLRINPFEFNENIHVLEHLERLIEIFSACWPLYAAMPAVLKSAFERAYNMHGWDLTYSIWTDMQNGKFPNFTDVKDLLPVIMNESSYSPDTKNDYIGSLVTRVTSLTTGMYGQIFNGSSITDEELFNSNTIVDLSRIPAADTKSLIMGVIIMKLTEFRQATSKGTNLPLKHVTILEEAHNILKRTSKQQGQETANVQGQSVQMISNAIAEMRTYGEGFIIVDQSPSNVDDSAIKNTNTKIIMNLPDTNDAEAIGTSIGLKEDQIMELHKLDKGIAVVYQNDWEAPVLTKIDKADTRYRIDSLKKADPFKKKSLKYSLLKELFDELNSDSIDPVYLNNEIQVSDVDQSYKSTLERSINEFCSEWKKYKNETTIATFVYQLLNCKDLFIICEPLLPNKVSKIADITPEILGAAHEWLKKAYGMLNNYADFAAHNDQRPPYVKPTALRYLLNYIIEHDKLHATQHNIVKMYYITCLDVGEAVDETLLHFD